MERTDVANDEDVLVEATRLRKILALGSAFGKGLWVGDLAEMREATCGPAPPAARHA